VEQKTTAGKTQKKAGLFGALSALFTRRSVSKRDI
jgi:hypothetical protein